jgi:hypothetical protein
MVLKASTGIHEPFQVLWDVGAIGSLTDAQLLDRFLADRDAVSEVCFTVLVERYGPNVRRVCFDLLGACVIDIRTNPLRSWPSRWDRM